MSLVREGSKIKLEYVIWGIGTGDWTEFTVESFRDCLGIFQNEQHREMGQFVPICELYERGPESENNYMPNEGEYITNMVPSFIIVEY